MLVSILLCQYENVKTCGNNIITSMYHVFMTRANVSGYLYPYDFGCSRKELTRDEQMLLPRLFEACCKNNGYNLLQLDAGERVVGLAAALHHPLYYRHMYLQSKDLPIDRILTVEEGTQAMNQWKSDFMTFAEKQGFSAKRNSFWAFVARLVGSTHVAKIVINFGLSDPLNLSLVLRNMTDIQESEEHQKTVVSNRTPLSDTENKLKKHARFYKCVLKKLLKQKKHNAETKQEAWCEMQIEEYNRHKRNFNNIVGKSIASASAELQSQRSVQG